MCLVSSSQFSASVQDVVDNVHFVVRKPRHLTKPVHRPLLTLTAVLICAVMDEIRNVMTVVNNFICQAPIIGVHALKVDVSDGASRIRVLLQPRLMPIMKRSCVVYLMQIESRKVKQSLNTR